MYQYLAEQAWQKLNIKILTMFSLVYNHLEIKIIAILLTWSEPLVSTVAQNGETKLWL